ncbi:MAG: Crp/Fnr family transcriptional regulator [Proteobacteria bacterium]|nr:Crp/Fnr family transcriptional regulator [Pseudomonadota bacterium]
MNGLVIDRPLSRLPQRPPASMPMGREHPGLPAEESDRIRAGVWFAGLSEPLHAAILGHARVREVQAGALLARRGDAASQWIGVVRGALRLGMPLADGRNFTLDFVAPGQWFGDIALIDERPLDLDVSAQAPSTLLVVSKADLRRLVDGYDEFGDALLKLNCQRLRHLLRRIEELHTLPLAERLAREVQRLVRHFGRATPGGICIDLGLSQADLAAMVGASRQRINQTLRQMHCRGIVRLGDARLVVLDEARLKAVAEGRQALADADPSRAR